MPEIINYLEKPDGWDQGIYALESYEQYQSIRALRSSELKRMRRSAAHYKSAIEFPKIFSPQQLRTFNKGKAFDTIVLHGRQAFEELVTIEPDLNRNTKEYKKWLESNSEAVCMLRADEKQEIIDMYEAAMRKKRFAEIFGGDGIAHRVIVWQCPRTALWCKAEIDWIMSDGTVVDLKSTADAEHRFFTRNAYRLGYLNQGAYYLDGLKHVTGIRHETFRLAAVEVEKPHESHVFRIGADQLDSAQNENEDCMWRLKICLETDEWPGYPDELIDFASGHYDLYADDMEEEKEIDVNGF